MPIFALANEDMLQVLQLVWRTDEGQWIVVGGADWMICVWDVESGHALYKVSVIPFDFLHATYHLFSCWYQNTGTSC